MPKFKVLSRHHLGGPNNVADVGDVVDLEEREGAYRTRLGLVAPHAEPPPPAVRPPEPATAEAAEGEATAPEVAEAEASAPEGPAAAMPTETPERSSGRSRPRH